MGPDKVIHIYGKNDDEAVMEGLTSDSTDNVCNMNRAAEENAIKFDHKLKRKLTHACAESVHRSIFFLEGNELKKGLQVSKRWKKILEMAGKT